MGSIVKLRDAAKLTGLSEWELRTGVISGKYPAMRVGGDHGRILFDLDLLKERIETLMLANVRVIETEEPEKRIRLGKVKL